MYKNITALMHKWSSESMMELHLKEHVLKDVDHVNDEEVQKFLALLQRYL
jgi:hypothetical protein